MITMKNLQVEDIKDEWLYNALTLGHRNIALINFED